MAIFNPVKDYKSKEHIWKGEDARFKWFDVQLSEKKEKLVIGCEPGEEVYFTAFKQDDKNYYKCNHCNGVWDQDSYPRLETEPFEHIKCPCCSKIVAQRFKT